MWRARAGATDSPVGRQAQALQPRDRQRKRHESATAEPSSQTERLQTDRYLTDRYQTEQFQTQQYQTEPIRQREGFDMAATTTTAAKKASKERNAGRSGRLASARMVGAEGSKAAGSFTVLPVGEPEVIEFGDDEHIAVAAMGDPKKPAKKPAAKPATKPAAKQPAFKPVDIPTYNKPKPTDNPLTPGSMSGAGGAKSSSTGENGDPDVAYAFTIEIDKVTYGMFAEIAGLSWKAEAIQVRQGGNNEYAENLRGPGKFEPLTLKRGWFASSGEFYQMLKDSLTGTGVRGDDGRFNLTVSVKGRKYQEIGRYVFSRAFLIEYTGPSLNSMSSQIGFEQIRFAYDRFEYQPV